MSKTMQWVLGILAVLAVGGAITMLILWDKEKKKNAAANKTGSSGTGSPRTTNADQLVDAGEATFMGTPAGAVARYSN